MVSTGEEPSVSIGGYVNVDFEGLINYIKRDINTFVKYLTNNMSRIAFGAKLIAGMVVLLHFREPLFSYIYWHKWNGQLRYYRLKQWYDTEKFKITFTKSSGHIYSQLTLLLTDLESLEKADNNSIEILIDILEHCEVEHCKLFMRTFKKEYFYALVKKIWFFDITNQSSLWKLALLSLKSARTPEPDECQQLYLISYKECVNLYTFGYSYRLEFAFRLMEHIFLYWLTTLDNVGFITRGAFSHEATERLKQLFTTSSLLYKDELFRRMSFFDLLLFKT